MIQPKAEASLTFHQGSEPGDVSVQLNGVEISQWISSIGIASSAKDKRPRVYLNLEIYGNLDVDLTDADVKVVERTREMLEALGWTPPAKED
jgi:hypothetical protein